SRKTPGSAESRCGPSSSSLRPARLRIGSLGRLAGLLMFPGERADHFERPKDQFRFGGPETEWEPGLRIQCQHGMPVVLTLHRVPETYRAVRWHLLIDQGLHGSSPL